MSHRDTSSCDSIKGISTLMSIASDCSKDATLPLRVLSTRGTIDSPLGGIVVTVSVGDGKEDEEGVVNGESADDRERSWSLGTRPKMVRDSAGGSISTSTLYWS